MKMRSLPRGGAYVGCSYARKYFAHKSSGITLYTLNTFPDGMVGGGCSGYGIHFVDKRTFLEMKAIKDAVT